MFCKREGWFPGTGLSAKSPWNGMEKPSDKPLQMSYMSTGSDLLLSKSLDSGATRKGFGRALACSLDWTH